MQLCTVGTYTVCTQYPDGLKSNIQTQLFSDNNVTDFESFASFGLKNFSAFPNPTNGKTDVVIYSTDKTYATITFYDGQGQRYKDELSAAWLDQGPNTIHMDVSSFSPGIYLCQVSLQNGVSLTERIVVTK